jgi:hypothetical protein
MIGEVIGFYLTINAGSNRITGFCISFVSMLEKGYAAVLKQEVLFRVATGHCGSFRGLGLLRFTGDIIGVFYRKKRLIALNKAYAFCCCDSGSSSACPQPMQQWSRNLTVFS